MTEVQTKKALKRTLIGRVTSDKMSKTVTVLVESHTKHPVLGKIIARTKKYHAHDENNDYHTGDVVEIVETKPQSRTKNWQVVQLLEKAKII
ncbi:MAG: 30S ribosomal protein S17 [Burkholderiaceae bacterium]|jgi:small subunit ribosomal protein S17